MALHMSDCRRDVFSWDTHTMCSLIFHLFFHSEAHFEYNYMHVFIR